MSKKLVYVVVMRFYTTAQKINRNPADMARQQELGCGEIFLTLSIGMER